jgi:hypothetical protein
VVREVSRAARLRAATVCANPAREGKLYPASVLDMASRRIAGFALGDHHDAQLAYGALALYQQLLPGMEQVLGPRHPHTLTTCISIAHLAGEGPGCRNITSPYQ